jgi:hypothetical protein
MVMVANLQLGWTLFVDPIDQKHHWSRYAIQGYGRACHSSRKLAAGWDRLPAGTDSWKSVFMIAVALDLLAALLALVVLKPLRKRLIAASDKSSLTSEPETVEVSIRAR